jgi:transposase
MTFIRHIKRGNNTYAYLVESYRENGKVKQRNIEYLGKVTGTGEDKVIIPPVHKRAIKTVNKRGAQLLAPLFKELKDSIMTSFGKTRGNKLFNLGLIQFLCPSPLKYVEWTANEHGIDDCNLSPTSLSKLLKNINPGELHRFFQQLRQDESTIVFDITSLSFYGERINLAEYGYNRDGDHLPQVNLCIAVNMGRTPIYFRMIRGSIPDVSTVEHTADELRSLGYSDIHLVFDRGFYSEDNIKSLKGFQFTGALPKRLNLFYDLVRSNLDVEHVGNVISYRNDKIMVCEIDRDGIRYILVHNPKIKHEQQENFMEKLLEREDKVKKKLGKASYDELKSLMGSYKRYFSINGETISRKKKAIQRTVNLMGKYIIFTNEPETKWPEVLDRYRSKDMVEKAFSILKNNGFLTPIRVWSDEALQGKLIASFVFYIIYSHITDKTDFTYNEILRLFNGMNEVKYANGTTSFVEMSKKQKKLLKDIGIEM